MDYQLSIVNSSSSSQPGGPARGRRINDYVNNYDHNAVHMGLEEFTRYGRNGLDNKFTYTNASTGTHARASSPAPSRARIPGPSPTLFHPGSRINIIGATAAKEIADSAAGFGGVKYQERDSALRVDGAGAGSTPCTRAGSFPIARSYKGGLCHDSFAANVASGPSLTTCHRYWG